MKMCMPVHGVKHCFDIPELVDRDFFHKHPPNNMPELGLAGTILSLIDFIRPQVRDTEFLAKLNEVTMTYINNFKEGLPKSVELNLAKEMKKAA